MPILKKKNKNKHKDRLSTSTKTRIRRLYKRGMSLEDITKQFPKVKPELYEVEKAIFCIKGVWWRNKYGYKEVRCSSCEFYKPYNLKYFPPDSRGGLEASCRGCKKLRMNNLRQYRKNMGIPRTDSRALWNTRARHYRTKIMRVIDPYYYYSKDLPKYILDMHGLTKQDYKLNKKLGQK